MKKLVILFVVLILPVIIQAQESANKQLSAVQNEVRDSILKMLLPEAENWRIAYNSKGINRISPFCLVKEEYYSSDLIGHKSYSANFQKEIATTEPIDSILIFSLNKTCDEVVLFSRQIGKARRPNVVDINIFTSRKINGEWKKTTHIEALKSQ